MKVVHISTSDTGGAGKAALRLHKGLLNEGVASKFLCLHKNTFEKEVYQYQERKRLNFVNKALRKLRLSHSQEIENEKTLKKFSETSEMFSFPRTEYNVLDAPAAKEADIVNLHWVAEYLDYSSFFANIKKPIVWTLHDKNPALGGFHLQLEKETKLSLAGIESKIAQEKQLIMSAVKTLDIVSPSRFLLNFSKQSKPLGRFNHHLIPNSIDTTIFKPFERAFAQSVFGIPPGKKNILFLNSASHHKGADCVDECIRTCGFGNVQFVGLGIGVSTHPSVIQIPRINDDRLMSLLYSAVDLLLLPSREDNLPNMMLEALACGTPVVGFPTGGICDVIKDGFTGFITKEMSSTSLNKGIHSFLKNEHLFQRNAIRTFSLQNFDISVQARRYKNLYESLLGNFSSN